MKEISLCSRLSTFLLSTKFALGAWKYLFLDGASFRDLGWHNTFNCRSKHWFGGQEITLRRGKRDARTDTLDREKSAKGLRQCQASVFKKALLCMLDLMPDR